MPCPRWAGGADGFPQTDRASRSGLTNRATSHETLRLDPIVRNSLLVLALGVALILAGIALAPPA